LFRWGIFILNKRIRKKIIEKLAIEIYNSNYAWCSTDVAIALASNYMFPAPKDRSSISEWNGIPITQESIITDRLNDIIGISLEKRNELLNGKWEKHD
jgi:hypothetical protein